MGSKTPADSYTACKSLSRDLNTGPADYKSAALPTKPLRRHIKLTLVGKKGGAFRHVGDTEFPGFSPWPYRFAIVHDPGNPVIGNGCCSKGRLPLEIIGIKFYNLSAGHTGTIILCPAVNITDFNEVE